MTSWPPRSISLNLVDSCLIKSCRIPLHLESHLLSLIVFSKETNGVRWPYNRWQSAFLRVLSVPHACRQTGSRLGPEDAPLWWARGGGGAEPRYAAFDDTATRPSRSRFSRIHWVDTGLSVPGHHLFKYCSFHSSLGRSLCNVLAMRSKFIW